MSKVKQLRRVEKRIADLNASIRALEARIERRHREQHELFDAARAIGWMMKCDDCGREHFVAAGQGVPRSWWCFDGDDYTAYSCGPCMDKYRSGREEAEFEYSDWRRCGKSRRQRRREKEQLKRSYWETEIVFLDERDWRLYRGTRLHFAGMIHGWGLPGTGSFGREVDLARCPQDDGTYNVYGSWYRLEQAPDHWRSGGEELLRRRGVSLE